MGLRLISKEHYANIATLPIALHETEIRRGDSVVLAQFTLTDGQRAVIKSINLAVIRFLNDGIVFDYLNSGFGIATVGVYSNGMVNSPIFRVSGNATGIFASNPYIDNTISLPGTYTVKLINNTGRTYQSSLDFAACVTGVIKIYA